MQIAQIDCSLRIPSSFHGDRHCLKYNQLEAFRYNAFYLFASILDNPINYYFMTTTTTTYISYRHLQMHLVSKREMLDHWRFQHFPLFVYNHVQHRNNFYRSMMEFVHKYTFSDRMTADRLDIVVVEE